MSPDTTPAPLKPQHRKSGLVGIALALLFTGALTTALHVRVALSEGPPARMPLTVVATSFQVVDSYTRPSSHLGLVVAGRKAKLGFEINGQLDSPPLREGSPVKMGDVIATLDQSTLQSRRSTAQAELEQARTELELAELRARRQLDLRATGAVSRATYDDTRLEAQAAQSRVDALTARLAGIDIELGKSRLVAPYDGVIADRYVHQGAVIAPGTPVVRLLETSHLEAHIGVPASRTEALTAGSSYTLKLRNNAVTASLLSVRPDVDPLTRAATAVFALPPGTQALDGEPVTLQLREDIAATGGWLPIAALLEGSRGVWTVLRIEIQGSSTRTVREAVEVLEVQGVNAFVRGTLAPDSLVVASGLHRISPGSLVTISGTN